MKTTKDFEPRVIKLVEASIATKQELVRSSVLVSIVAKVSEVLIKALQEGGKLLLFGNGGSAADAQHIAAEFVGRYRCERTAIPAMALTVNSSTVTALANDYGYDEVFARQVAAFGTKNDAAIGISTSGNSP